MAELLLTSEDLVTPSRRRLRREFPLGLPQDLSALSKAQKDLAKELFDNKDDEAECELSTNYARLYFNLLLLSAVQPPYNHDEGQGHPDGRHFGAGSLRDGRIAEVAAARMLDLWLDPEVRASCSMSMDYSMHGASFVSNILCTRCDCSCVCVCVFCLRIE